MNKLSRIVSGVRTFYLTTRPKPWRLEKPVVMQFPVNDICNSHCQMCNVWRQKLGHQITPTELAHVLSSPLFSEIRSVGVNGGEPTLRCDLADLVEVLFTSLPKLSGISLITNAIHSQQVIARITEVAKVVSAYNGRLTVMVSLDGVGEVHDRVRGTPGNFENAVKVIDFAKTAPGISRFRLGCTVIRKNVYGLHELLEFAMSKDVYIKYRLGIPHQRLYSQDVSDPFALTFAEKYHLVVFLENLIKYYETEEQQKYFYRSLIGQLWDNRPRTAGCDWQHRGVTLLSNGELLYCAVASKTLGSAITQDPEKLYFENEQHLRDIVTTRCATCMHDYVGLPPAAVILRNYAMKLKKKIGTLSVHSVPVLTRVWGAMRTARQQSSFRARMRAAGVKATELEPATVFPQQRSGERKVLICGWYGTETLGDKAILGGVVNALQRALGNFELHLASLSLPVSQMTAQQMSELEDGRLHTTLEAIGLAEDMDLVVFGGGPLMAINPLAEMASIFQRAVEARVPTLIAGCGVGPLGGASYNRAIAQILHLATHRIYRDHKSMSIARSLGIDTTKDAVAEDPAFTWLKDCQQQHETAIAASPVASNRTSLLLGLRDWPYRQYASAWSVIEAEQVKSHFEREVIAALELLLEQFPVLEIIPFPMCTNHLGGDDRWFYRRLFRNSPKIQRALDTTWLEAEPSPLASVNVFRNASAVLAMRFHSLVFALSVGANVVAVDYTLGHGKVKALAQQYDVPHASLDEVDREFLVTQIAQALHSQRGQPVYAQQPTLFEQAVASFVRRIQV